MEISEFKEKAKLAIERLESDLKKVRTGRAHPDMLDGIKVEAYGVMTPLNQVANISVPEPRMIVIQPWEKTLVGAIEKAILKSDLGLNPNSDGSAIRLVLPQLTQERRAELVKQVHKKAEETRVGIRNLRRDTNDAMKKLEKDKTISEDELKKAQEDTQKLTDKYIKEVDQVMASKEKEILEL